MATFGGLALACQWLAAPAGLCAQMAKLAWFAMAAAEHHARTARRAADSATLVVRGIVLNAVLAVVKLAGGIFGNTYALVADAAESLLALHPSSLL